MAELLTCTCGQSLDVSDYTAGQQVRCPACQEVLTVPAPAAPAAAPPMAMAVAIDDESSQVRPAAAATGGKRDPMARRRMAERRSTNAAQAKLKKFMIWPCLVLGLASFGVGAFGLREALVPRDPIQLQTTTDPDSGVEITKMFANVETTPGSKVYEHIEVQPDIYPGDWTNGDDFTLNGVKPSLRSGAWIINYEDKEMAVERRGYWFYEVDLTAAAMPAPVPAAPVDTEAIRNETVETPEDTTPATTTVSKRRLLRKVELPLVAMTRQGTGEFALYEYKPVRWQDKGFVEPESGKPITNVSYYRINKDTGMQDQLIMGEFEKHEVSPLTKLASPMFFIVSGPLVGLLLLAGAVFFAWESYFSPAAKERRRREADQRAAMNAS